MTSKQLHLWNAEPCPRGCRDVDAWEDEQRTLRTARRHPHLRIEAHERYRDIAMHMARWFRPYWQTTRALDVGGAITCKRCEGNGGYNLRRSGLGYGWAWAMCCVCLGYGRVLPEVRP